LITAMKSKTASVGTAGKKSDKNKAVAARYEVR
jgi:hypothetical protein